MTAHLLQPEVSNRMVVLLIGHSKLAGDFALAAEHGGRDYVWIDAHTSTDLGLDELKALMHEQVSRREIHAVICATFSVAENQLAEAGLAVAKEASLPLLFAGPEGLHEHSRSSLPARAEADSVIEIVRWLATVE